MEYISTRGNDKVSGFSQSILEGLAKDGGLFMPASYPQFTPEKISSFKNLSYAELAFEVISPFVDGDIPDADLKQILNEVYSEQVFRDEAIAPVKNIGEGEHLLELFHGPTLAFKDFALQFLGRIFDYLLQDKDYKINILGATSGDTGSAAIAGCAGRENINIFILHPHNKVSEVQRRQMTTILADNVHNIAVEGNFDDCQNIVKELFGDLALKEKDHLSAVNSINWGRIVAQIVYYFYAAAKFDEPVSFSVPTGNFGDILAGYIAHKMGLPIKKLVIATNKNDILHRFIQTGKYTKTPVEHSLSPSMDIQISSNFERLLFDYHDRDGEIIASKINDLKENGEFEIDGNILKDIKELFASSNIDDDETLATISKIHQSCGEILDPHSAIGVLSAQENKGSEPIITLATAHPAKFPDAVIKACGAHPELPKHLSDLFEREEKFEISTNSAQNIQDIISNYN